MNLEIRNDDALLATPDSQCLKRSFSRFDFFERFKEVDKVFEKHNIPQIVTVLAEGIDIYPEWVKYIKERQDRIRVEMHGWGHLNYRIYDEEFAYQLLKTAKEKIEDSFQTKVSRWYVPHGRLLFPSWGKDVCSKLGIKFHTTGGTIRHVYFHYWNPISVEKTFNILKGNKWRAMYDK